MDRMQIGLWQLEMRGRKCAEALRKNGFDAHFLPDRDAVRDRVLAECEPAATIGFGGSMSIAEMKIQDALSGRGSGCWTTGGCQRRRRRRRGSPSSPAICSSRDERGDARRLPGESRHER